MLATAPSRQPWRRLAIAVAVIGLLLGGALAATPLLIDSDAVKHVVEREISARANGEVRYDSLALRFFPQPRAEIRNATVRIPGALEGRIGALDIRIALLSLLAGNVRPVAVRVGQPVLEVRIDPGRGGGDPLATYRAVLGPIVDALTREARGMSFGIDDGRVDLVYAGQRILSLAALSADAEVAVDAITASASGAADRWGTAKAAVKIAPGSLATTVTLQVSGLRLTELLQAAGAQGDLRVVDGTIAASLDLGTDGRASVRATLTASAPGITLARGPRKLDLGPVRTAVDALRDGTVLSVSLRELRVGDLIPAATGVLRARPDGMAPAVDVQVPALDLARLRSALAALAGDRDAVRAALAFVPTGTAQGLRARAAGSDLGSLAALGSIRAETRVAAAALELPAQAIAVQGGTGRFVLADGRLQGSELAGALGKSAFSRGSLVVDLAPEPALRKLEAAVDADLAETLAIARRVIGKPEPAALADIESLHGRASGTVAYEAHPRHPRVAVEFARIRGTGRYRGVPLPIAVTGGQLRYARDRLVVNGLDGTLGSSRLEGGAMELELEPEPAVRAASADAVLMLDELGPWLETITGLRLAAGTSAAGITAVRLTRLSGPLNAPAALGFDVTIRPQQMRLTAPELPGPLTLASGELRVAPDTLALDRLDASVLDAQVVASGTVQDYASPDPRFDLALTAGRAGEAILEWARMRWRLPPNAMPRAPVTLGAGRLQRSGGAGAPLLAQGTLDLAAGASVEFDLTVGPGRLELRRAVVKDQDSDAVASLTWAPSTVELGFSGKLDNRTLARVLAEPPAGRGVLQGDFRATVDLAAPRESTATGVLEGERIDVLERWWGIPVGIERLRLDAAGDTVQIQEGVFSVAGDRLAVAGAVTRWPKTLGVDLRFAADQIDADRLRRAFPQLEPARAGADWNLPVEGRVAVDVKSLAHGTHTFESLIATVTLAPNRIAVEAGETHLCGVALPFIAVLVPGSMTVSGRASIRGRPLTEVASCVTGEVLAVTGTLDLDADIAATGPYADVLRAARGSFQVSAREGVILRAPAITRILALDSVATALRARPSELMKDGLAYTEIDAAGTFEAGRVRIERGTFDAPALGIAMVGEIDLIAEQLDMRGLVAPFGDVHRAVKRVPILGRVLGARVVGIPVSVTGSLGDPLVVPLAPAAVGQSLVNLMSAIVKVPIDLFDPLAGQPPRAP